MAKITLIVRSLIGPYETVMQMLREAADAARARGEVPLVPGMQGASDRLGAFDANARDEIHGLEIDLMRRRAVDCIDIVDDKLWDLPDVAAVADQYHITRSKHAISIPAQ